MEILYNLTVGFMLFLSFQGCFCITHTSISELEGKSVKFVFTYPCDSTVVTLRHSTRQPFYQYQSTDGEVYSLKKFQEHRLTVQNINQSPNCSLTLQIRNIMEEDRGTYFTSVYMEGDILNDNYTQRVGLQINYPPSKLSCVLDDDSDGVWITLKCTADAGTLSGKVECYQNVTKILDIQIFKDFRQTIQIKKTTLPVFCCASLSSQVIDRCMCNDTVYPPDTNQDPCPVTAVLYQHRPTVPSTEIVSKKTEATSFQAIEEDIRYEWFPKTKMHFVSNLAKFAPIISVLATITIPTILTLIDDEP